MCNLSTDNLIKKIIDRGISSETIEILENRGIDIKRQLHGLAIDPETGKLDLIVNGYN